MGHCEMLLAVAGLDKSALDERTRRLASGDWSSFPPGDRAAYQFARKQSTEPSSITAEDTQRLVDHFGTERTLDVLFWACRCHYMTRVADAFQIPLERENVFEGMQPPQKAGEAPAPKKTEKAGEASAPKQTENAGEAPAPKKTEHAGETPAPKKTEKAGGGPAPRS
jgi:hypothetical protein